jgi:hypothetical protein
MTKQVKLELTEETLRVYGSRRRTVAASVQQQQQQQQGAVVTVAAAAVADDPDDLATASMTAFQVSDASNISSLYSVLITDVALHGDLVPVISYTS